ncbi:MAG: outer membrane protein assembly factor BamD [Candidatus Koribacter versatilis]|uniref:Outer membrane protein assembly factor BamD n=1 Tax=Candidatus Korobacter versatilis TaxID=658062 RepID=A0A932EPL9_9BACT|nr:outer membrane protein assembly factor BamD [Candidatus Koribacter versatilis]
MVRKVLIIVVLSAIAILATGCHKNKVVNPIADVNSKQPDKVLFDRAMDAMQHSKYDIARLSLQTLINTYPDSEYIARAKLSVGDSWYAEGGSTGLAQAEIEYKDFITFFPNMPEAAEAQLKVANIHHRQMEKPDRDYTHAKRAEDEYKQLIQQFPDSKLVPEAKQHLLQVQEVLAEREFRIGRFYFLRESYAASIARLKSLSDNYPLYSGSDEALFLLGASYEKLIDAARANGRMPETMKGKLIGEYAKHAAEAYGRIITRYPAMDRRGDAQERLEAMKLPVPTPTAEAVKLNQAEEASRSEPSKREMLMGLMRKNPDTSRAAKVGEPQMEEPKETSATEVARQTMDALRQGAPAADTKLGLEGSAGTGTAPASEAPPSSTPQLNDATPPPAETPASAASTPIPPQTNEAATEQASQDQAQAAGQTASEADKKTESTSKKKKKKGMRKLIPF